MIKLRFWLKHKIGEVPTWECILLHIMHSPHASLSKTLSCIMFICVHTISHSTANILNITPPSRAAMVQQSKWSKYPYNSIIWVQLGRGAWNRLLVSTLESGLENYLLTLDNKILNLWLKVWNFNPTPYAVLDSFVWNRDQSSKGRQIWAEAARYFWSRRLPWKRSWPLFLWLHFSSSSMSIAFHSLRGCSRRCNFICLHILA